MKGGGQLYGKGKKVREAWSKDKPAPEPAPRKAPKARGSRRGGGSGTRSNRRQAVTTPNSPAATASNSQADKPLGKWAKGFNRAEKTGDFIETLGNTGKGATQLLKDTVNLSQKIFGGGGDSGIVSGGIGSVAKSGADSDAAKQAASGSTGVSAAKNIGKSGLGSGLMKTIGRRALGPLGYIADATAIASAEPGKARNQAIGSAVGGSVGAAIGGFFGSVIPVAGTMVGSTIGGTLGSYAGEKLGGAITGISEQFKEGKKKMSKWFSNTFSFGKKDKEAAQQKDVLKSPPSSPTVAVIPAPIIRKSSSIPFNKPLLPDLASYGSYIPPSHSSSSRTFGPPASAARNQAMAGTTSPQSVQISPEQMSMFAGYFRDFKTETTVNYNLPSGAVQVTVNEEHPVDVEGLILLIGQRLRVEMTKAAQNRKPSPMAY